MPYSLSYLRISESTKVSEKVMDSNSMDLVNEHMLFGGAFSAALPAGIQDVSELRQIPDNQEIFAHIRTDQSIIMELLEYQKHVADANAARYHFEDIASINDAASQGTSEVLSVEPIPKSQIVLDECQTAWFLTGRQMVSKFNEEARNTVDIYMCLFRLPQFTTDIIITFNNPSVINPSSSSAASSATSALEEVPTWTLEDFRVFSHTLRLRDPKIFG